MANDNKMTEIEKRILENQRVMLDALLYLTMACDTEDRDIRGVVERRLALDQARTKTETVLKSADERASLNDRDDKDDQGCVRVHHERKGCDVCTNPTAWQEMFGCPYPFLDKKGTRIFLCPVCGRQLPLTEDGRV